MTLSYRTRMILLMGAGVLGVLVALGYLSSQALHESTQAILDERQRRAELAVAFIDHRISEAFAALRSAVVFEDIDPTAPAPYLEHQRPELGELYAGGPFTYNVFLTDARGVVLLVEPRRRGLVGADLSAYPYVRKALATGQPQVSNLIEAPVGGQTIISFVVPVKDRHGAVVGLLGGGIDPTAPSFAGFLRPIQVEGRGSYIQVMDSNGRVIAHSQGTNLLQRAEHADVLIDLLAAGKPGIVTREVVEEGRGRFREVIAFAPSQVAPWGVFIEQPEAEALALVRGLQRRWMMIGFGILVFVLFMHWAVTQTVSVPVRRLLDAAQRIAAGDLRTPVAIGRSQDEIAELGRTFESMRQQLLAWGEELERRVRERTRELSTLYTIDRAAAQSLELETILNDALDATLETLGMRAGAILLLEPNGDGEEQQLVLQVHRGLSDAFVEAIRQVGASEGVSGRAVAEAQPVVLDVSDYPAERLVPLIVEEGFQTLASIPLVSAGRVLGALTLGSEQSRAFPPEELELLTAIGQQLGSAVQNARLYEEAQRRLATLEGLREVSAAVIGELELNQVLEVAVKAAAELVGGETVSICLLDPDGQTRTHVAAFGPQAIWLQGRSAPAASGIHGLVIESGCPLRLADVTDDPRVSDLGREMRVASMAVAPLRVRGRIIGTLSALRSRPDRPFTAQDEFLLAGFADQVAIAIHNARLLEREQHRASQLSVVAQIARRAVAQLDPDALLWETARAIQEAFDYPDVLIALVDHDRQALVRKAWAGIYQRTGPVEQYKPITDRGILDWVATHGQTVLANDVHRDPRYVPFFPETASELCVPIKDGEKVVGCINAESNRSYAFSEADVTALEILADELAVALRNAHLFAEEQRRIAELAALNQVGQALMAPLELDELLEVIHRQVTAAMPAEAFFIALYDAEANVLDYRVRVDRDVREPPERRVPGGLTGRIVTTGEPILIREWQREKQGYPQPAKVWGTMEIPDSWLGVPMKVGERVAGVISVQAYRPQAYDEGHLDLLSTIAGMAAVAVERARLYGDMSRHLAELSALFEVGQAITAAARVQDVLDLVAQVAPQVLHAEGSCVFLWDEREQWLVLRASVGGPDEAVGRMKYRQGEGLAGWVFVAGEPANVPDLAADPRWKRESEYEGALPSGRANNALMVPLKVGGKTLGVLGVVNKVAGEEWPATFTAADESLLLTMAGQTAIAIENARLYEDVRDLSLGAVRALVGAIDARDPYTRGHSEEVTRLAVALARELGWAGADLEMLEFAALLHDVGKIGIPDEILRKTAPLTPEDWNIIHLHPYHSAQIVKPVEPLQCIVPWVYHHQERWDGTGYPDGLKGEAIPMASRIIAVADAYNAMTTDRPYRPAMSHEEALEELKHCAGTRFDPQVVEAFLRVVEDHTPEVLAS